MLHCITEDAAERYWLSLTKHHVVSLNSAPEHNSMPNLVSKVNKVKSAALTPAVQKSLNTHVVMSAHLFEFKPVQLRDWPL